MRTSIGVDLASRLVTVTIEGKLTEDGVSDFFDAVLSHTDFEPGMDVMADVRKASMELSSPSIARLIAYFNRNLARRGAGRDVIVTGTTVDFGVGRMIEAYTEESLPYDVRVFASLVEARQWLSAQSNQEKGGS